MAMESLRDTAKSILGDDLGQKLYDAAYSDKGYNVVGDVVGAAVTIAGQAAGARFGHKGMGTLAGLGIGTALNNSMSGREASDFHGVVRSLGAFAMMKAPFAPSKSTAESVAFSAFGAAAYETSKMFSNDGSLASLATTASTSGLLTAALGHYGLMGEAGRIIAPIAAETISTYIFAPKDAGKK